MPLVSRPHTSMERRIESSYRLLSPFCLPMLILRLHHYAFLALSSMHCDAIEGRGRGSSTHRLMLYGASFFFW